MKEYAKYQGRSSIWDLICNFINHYSNGHSLEFPTIDQFLSSEHNRPRN